MIFPLESIKKRKKLINLNQPISRDGQLFKRRPLLDLDAGRHLGARLRLSKLVAYPTCFFLFRRRKKIAPQSIATVVEIVDSHFRTCQTIAHSLLLGREKEMLDCIGRRNKYEKDFPFQKKQNHVVLICQLSSTHAPPRVCIFFRCTLIKQKKSPNTHEHERPLFH